MWLTQWFRRRASVSFIAHSYRSGLRKGSCRRGTIYENLTRLCLDGPALARALGDPGWERLEASLVSGGKSNLTFELTSDAGEAVLRRPPDRPLLPRAHDMGREARVQRALAGTAVPVATILFEDAGELIRVAVFLVGKDDRD